MDSENKCGKTLPATDIADWYYGTTKWCSLPRGHKNQCLDIKPQYTFNSKNKELQINIPTTRKLKIKVEEIK